MKKKNSKNNLFELKRRVLEANLSLVKHHLVIFTWGNVSGIDRERGLVVIKPSGVDYDKLTSDQMVVTDLTGHVIEGNLRPSSDLQTHLVLYKCFRELSGVVHTHSPWATAWAQSGKSIPALGTTHADFFYGSVPCTRSLTREETENGYEENTGHVIKETFRGINPMDVPGVLVQNHGPFIWGKSLKKAVQHAVILEEIAKIAYYTLALSSGAELPSYILDKHYRRKHGPDAYYGQG